MNEQALAAILMWIAKMQGTPYIPGGNSPAGTDCSGLASVVANIASGRDPFSGRFTTRNEGVKVTGKVGFSSHPMIEHYKFVAAHTKRTPKITIPAGLPEPTTTRSKRNPCSKNCCCNSRTLGSREPGAAVAHSERTNRSRSPGPVLS